MNIYTCTLNGIWYAPLNVVVIADDPKHATQQINDVLRTRNAPQIAEAHMMLQISTGAPGVFILNQDIGQG